MYRVLLIALLFGFNASAQPLRFTPKGQSVIEVRINFSLAAVTVATYNNLFGAPKTGVRSLTDMKDINGLSTPWDITTVATNNWLDATFNVSATDGIAGVTVMSFLTGATSGVYANAYYNYGTTQPATYDAARHQLLISGLNPLKTYELKMTGMDGTYTFDCSHMRYQVTGLTTPATQDINGDVTSQPNGATFTIQPAADGTIKIWMNTVSGSSDLNMTAAMIIKQL